jgi:BlaI family penicillinase repressor
MRKTGSARDIPPPLELLCLKALWALQEGNVKDVQRVISENRSLAYTTVMTLLERLVRKGIVTRRKGGRAFLYSPLVGRDALRRLALQQFLDLYFEGSEEALLEFLQEGRRASAAAADGGSGERHEAPLDAVLL